MVNFSLPVVILFVEVLVVLLWLNHVKVALVIILALLATHYVDNALHVSHEFEFVLERVRGPLRDHSIKGVPHDGDQHVKESDLRDEGGTQEDHVAHSIIDMVLEALRVELTKHQQVLVERCVDDWKTECGLNDVALLAKADIQL